MSDNGKEFAEHVRIAEVFNANFYFAHPYSAWERRTHENRNGLVRQYFPKKTDFSNVALSDTMAAVNRLNHRPGKCLTSEPLLKYSSINLLHFRLESNLLITK